MSTIVRSSTAVTIEPEGLYRLAGECRSVTIVDGIAWITAEGRDIIARAGRALILDGSEQPILISGLHGQGVTLRIMRDCVTALAA